MVTADVLRRIAYFAELDGAALEEVRARARLRRYRKGETILEEGEACPGLFFVVEGRVKVFKVSAEGREQVIRLLGPGRTFNDVPVFDGGANPGSATALEPSTIGFLPTAAVHALLERQPCMGTAVIRVLAGRLRSLTVMLEDLAFRSVVARVAKLLLDCAQGRSAVMEGAAAPCAHLTQQQVAAMTGSVREVVQRALKALEREGAIRLERARVVVLDVEALERWSQPLSALPA